LQGWALAVVHPCSWRSNSSDISRFDWRRNKGHANGAPRSAAHHAQDLSKGEGSLRLTSRVALVLVMK